MEFSEHCEFIQQIASTVVTHVLIRFLTLDSRAQEMVISGDPSDMVGKPEIIPLTMIE